MITFCKTCDAPLPSGASFCSKCGSPVGDAPTPSADHSHVADEPVVLPMAGPAEMPASMSEAAAVEPEPANVMDDAPPKGTNWLLIGGAVGTLLVIGLLYFFLFVRDDLGDGSTAEATTASSEETPTEAQQYFAMTEANIRDKPTTKGSAILGKLPRGSAITGKLVNGTDDPTSNWLELADGKGYISSVNLSDVKPPELTKMLGDKIWTADADIDIWKAPDSSSELVSRASSGTKLTLSGLTANDYIEVKLASGGVGYIADGAAVLARAGGKPIAINFNSTSCSFGPDVDAILDRIGAKMQANYHAAEDKEYPTDDARDAALSKIEGQSAFEKIQRSYNGLSVTGVGQHYESQSLYFADPPAKVIEVLRAQGYKIGNDGQFPSDDVSSGISATNKLTAAYGKSSLDCGV